MDVDFLLIHPVNTHTAIVGDSASEHKQLPEQLSMLCHWAREPLQTVESAV